MLNKKKVIPLAKLYIDVGDEYFKNKCYLDAIGFYEKSIFFFKAINIYIYFYSIYKRIGKCYNLLNDQRYLMSLISAYEFAIKYYDNSNIKNTKNNDIIDIKRVLIQKYFYANEYKRSIDMILDMQMQIQTQFQSYCSNNDTNIIKYDKNNYFMYAVLISLISGYKRSIYNICVNSSNEFEKSTEGRFVFEITEFVILKKNINNILLKYDRLSSMNKFIIDIIDKIKKLCI